MRALAVLSTSILAALVVAHLSGGIPRLRTAARPRDPSGTAQLLSLAGVPTSPAVVHLASIVLGAAVLLLVVGISGIPALGLLPAGLAVMTPRLLLRRRAGALLHSRRTAWPDAIAQMGGVIRSGRTLHEALVALADDPPPPLAPLLRGLEARIRAVGTVGALQAVGTAAAEPVTERVVEVLCIAHEAGGRVVPDILDDLAHGIGEEIRVADEIQQLSHEGRLNAKLVFALPWVVLVVLTAGGGPYRLFYASPAGTVIIAIASVLSTIGIVVVGRLSDRRTPTGTAVQLR